MPIWKSGKVLWADEGDQGAVTTHTTGCEAGRWKCPWARRFHRCRSFILAPWSSARGELVLGVPGCTAATPVCLSEGPGEQESGADSSEERLLSLARVLGKPAESAWLLVLGQEGARCPANAVGGRQRLSESTGSPQGLVLPRFLRVSQVCENDAI